jgi:hypothetical protein
MRSHAKASIAIAALSCGIVLCLCAPAAMAAKTVVGFVGSSGAQGGQFANPADAAVNLGGTGGASAGDLYVIDRGNNRVQQFHADGTWVRAFGIDVIAEGKPNDVSTTAFEICDSTAAVPNVPADCKAASTEATAGTAAGAMRAPQGVAIEQSTGNLYVTDQTNRRVDVYAATGAFQGAFGWDVTPGGETTLEFCTTVSGCKAGSTGANAGQFGGLIAYPAINSANGHILIASRANARVDEFEATIAAGVVTGAAFVRAFGWKVNKEAPAEAFQTCTTVTGCQAGGTGAGIGQFGVVSPSAVAADSTGRTYVFDFFNNRVQAFSAAPTPEGVFAPALLGGELLLVDIAVDQSSGHLLATKPCSALSCPGAASGEQRVLELDAAGNLVQSWAAKSGIPSSTGLAVGSNTAYMTTATGGPSNKPGFFILGDPVPPAVTIDPVTTFTGTTATFEGDVKTDTIEARYHFEYSLDGITWTRLPAKSSEDKSVPGDKAEHAVSVEVEGLVGLSEYQVKLVAEKAYAGGSASAQTSFTTASASPLLSNVSHSHVRDTTAQLDATINPENEETEYHFEFTDQPSFEAEGFAGAESAPVPPGQLSGGEAKEVHEPISGLEPETTYRYRLLASNDTGNVESAVGTFTTYASPQIFDPCPNDNEFRINKPAAALPDCRAYEQATPTSKNGGNVQSEFTQTKASPSGHRISFEAVAGLPGGEGSQTFPTYFATRAGGGWSTQGMLPPASTGIRASVLGWTPDFAQVFSSTTRFGEGNALLSRSSADGSLTTIVPNSLGASLGSLAYVDASADGSIVLFGATSELPVIAGSPDPAAGLTKGNGNLYAWDRDTGVLYFAGALPDGTAPAKGQKAGFASTNILDTPLGYPQDANAVAADGSVYFTDLGTRQLYRRLNPTAPETTTKDGKGNCVPDPVLACTVHVSASEKDDGGGLEGHDAAGPQAARFLAASTDGSKAIFTSSEKLTNDAYTGVEPEPAAIARADKADGDNKNLGFIPTSAREIAVDEAEEYVYWTDPDHGQIGRAKLDGTGFTPNYISGLGEPRGIAVIDEAAAKYIFWTDRGELDSEGNPQAGKGTIGRADLDGGEVKPDCYTGLDNPRSVAVRPDFVYWTMPRISSPSDGDLAKAELSCNQSSVTQVPLTIPGGQELPMANGDIAVDTSHFYLSTFESSFNTGFIRVANLDGTDLATIVVVDGVESPPSVALDGSHVYWTDPDNNQIGRADLDGGNPANSFIAGAGRAVDPAVGGAELLWSTNQEVVPNPGNDIYSYDSEAPAGERLTDLAPEDDGENGIEVQGVLGASEDASYVYFVANGIPDAGVSNSPNANGEEAETGDCEGTSLEGASGICNLYLAHEGEITFIARLDPDSPAAGEWISDASNWVASPAELNGSSISEKTARVSADGQTLLFRSQRQLTGYDNEGPNCVRVLSGDFPCVEFFRYRVGEPGLVCVSCNPTGAAPLGPSTLISITTGEIGASDPAPVLSRNLSADGDRVFFETPDALVAADTNGDESCNLDDAYRRTRPSCQDVYEWEAAGTGSCPDDAGQQGCVYLLSTGTSTRPSFFGDASLSGDDAFIFTNSQLVRQDEDALLDVYDARVEGGLSSQDTIPPVPCEGEACKAGASTPPANESAGTASFNAPGNPPAVHKKANKKKKKRRRHHRAKKRHAKHHNRAAKTTGRASR